MSGWWVGLGWDWLGYVGLFTYAHMHAGGGSQRLPFLQRLWLWTWRRIQCHIPPNMPCRGCPPDMGVKETFSRQAYSEAIASSPDLVLFCNRAIARLKLEDGSGARGGESNPHSQPGSQATGQPRQPPQKSQIEGALPKCVISCGLPLKARHQQS